MMPDFHECPYCGEELEQWSLRYYRADRERAGQRSSAGGVWGESTDRGSGAGVASPSDDGLTLLSLCPNERCGYYVLRYRNGLSHWDRDVEAARLLRAVFGDE